MPTASVTILLSEIFTASCSLPTTFIGSIRQNNKQHKNRENLLNKVEGIKESLVYEKKDEDGDVKVCTKIVYDKDLIKDLYNIEGEDNIREFLWNKVKEVNNLMPKYKYIKLI